MLIIENNVRVRHGKKWKERWGVMKKLSPVANSPCLVLYKDNTKTQEKSTILLDNYYGVWEGCGLLEGEEHLLSIISLKPLLFAFKSDLVLKRWKETICHCLGSCSLFQVAFSDEGLPMRRKSDSRRQLSPSTTTTSTTRDHHHHHHHHHLFITSHHVTITSLYPPLEHVCSWHFPDIKEIIYEARDRVRFTVDDRRTGFYWVVVNTPQAKSLHEELLKNSDNFWKTRKTSKNLNFPMQATSLSSTSSDFMFSLPFYRQLLQPRKLSVPLKSRFMKACNSSFQGTEQEPRDALMRHHSDYNLPSNSSFRKLSQSLLRKLHHSSDELQDSNTNTNEADRMISHHRPSAGAGAVMSDNLATITPYGLVTSNNAMCSSLHSNRSIPNEDASNGLTRAKSKAINREMRSSTHSPHFHGDSPKAHLPPKRYSLGKLKPARSDTHSLKSFHVREKLPFETTPMAQSLLEDSTGELNQRPFSQYKTPTTNFSATNLPDVTHFPATDNSPPSFSSSQAFDRQRPLPYTDLRHFDGYSNQQPYHHHHHTFSNGHHHNHDDCVETFLSNHESNHHHHNNSHKDTQSGEYLQPLPTIEPSINPSNHTTKAPPIQPTTTTATNTAFLDRSEAIIAQQQHQQNHNQHHQQQQQHQPTSKCNENYISIDKIDLNYPIIIDKTTTSNSTDHGGGSCSLGDSETFSNHASSMEDSVFLSNELFDRRDKCAEDDAFNKVVPVPIGCDVVTSVKSIYLTNTYNDENGDLSSSTSSIHAAVPPPPPLATLRSQHYINIYSPPPLPPKTPHKTFHARSGSSDQGRLKKEVDNHQHTKPPLPKRSNYLCNNNNNNSSSSQHSSYPLPSPLNKVPNRPVSAKSHSLKHRKPDLTIDTGAHHDSGLEMTTPRKAHDARFSNVVYSGNKIKDVFDCISLQSAPQEHAHQSSPSLATSKPRTGQEYINRCYLNDSQRSPMRGSAFTFDDKPPSSGGYDDGSPLTPSTSSLKSPTLKPELLSKQPNGPLPAKQFFFPSSENSEKKLNYADLVMIEKPFPSTPPILSDQTVYAKIDYLATKAVSHVSKQRAKQREDSLDKQIDVSSPNLSEQPAVEKRRFSMESRRLVSRE